MLDKLLLRIKRRGFARTARAIISTVYYFHLLLPLLVAPPRSRLGRYVRARPEILELAFRNFIAANWDTPTKIRRAVNHVRTTAAIRIFDFPPDSAVNLLELHELGNYRVTIDQIPWLFHEGQLVLSLWEDNTRFFWLSFSLCTEQHQRVAYVGGIQGRPQVDGEPDIIDRYRRFAKAAFGSRPRDFLVETAKLLLKSVDVKEIHAVADNNHPRKDEVGFKLSYNEIWQERGGVDNGTGFFVIPTSLPPKAEEEIPAKKRTGRRRLAPKRAALFGQIEAQLRRCVESDEVIFRPTPREIHPVDKSEPSDPFRILAYASALFVLGVTKLFGGTWASLTIGLVLVFLVHKLLQQPILSASARALHKLRSLRLLLRFGIGFGLMALPLAADILWGGDYSLGRAFKVYLLPIFLSSLFLGGRVTFAVTITCVAALDFFHLPPRYTFSTSTTDGLDLLIFCGLSVIVFLIPRLLLASTELAKTNQGSQV